MLALPARRLPEAPAEEPSRIALPPGAALSVRGQSPIALSPRGDALVFSARRSGRRQLFVQWLPGRARPLPGTAGAMSPFFSADGRRAGFFAARGLHVVRLDGGPVRRLCAAPEPGGGAWDASGQIVFSSGGALYRVSERDGRPATLTAADTDAGETRLSWPAAHPGGGLLFEVETTRGSSIAALRPASGRRRTVVADARRPRLGNGRLVFERGGLLLSAPLDGSRLALSGAPAPVASGVLDTGGPPPFDVSAEGSVAWASRAGTRGSWLDRRGRSRPIALPETVRALALSPDGRRALAVDEAPAGARLLSVDLRSGETATLGDEVAGAVWADGGRGVVVARRTRDGSSNLFRHAARPGAGSTRLTWSAGDQHPTGWSSRARVVVFDERSPAGDRDVAVLLLGETLETRLLAASPADEHGGRLSPDGRWLAYVSDRTGREEVYVRAYPFADGVTRVSERGGSAPAWRPSGRRLLFLARGEVVEASLEGGRPRPLFEAPAALRIEPAPNGLVLALERRGFYELRVGRRLLGGGAPLDPYRRERRSP